MLSHLSAAFLVLGLAAACDEPTAPIAECVPEGQCDSIRSAVTTTFSSVGGDAQRGRGLFEEKCARCHGKDGKGMGKPARGDFTSLAWQKGKTDNQIRLAVTRGRGMMMPAFPIEDEQMKDLVSYVRSLKVEPKGGGYGK